MSRVEADRTIKLLEEFGPAYFELSQLTLVSPDTYRAIAPHIENGVLHSLCSDAATPRSPSRRRRPAAHRNAAQCCFISVTEFEKIARDERLGITRIFFQKTVTMMRDEMARVASENGL